MSRRKRTTRNPKTVLVIALVVMILGGVGYAVWQQETDDRAGLRNTDSAFNVPDLVGRPAPQVTATGADGQPYTFAPGDGRPKAIAFYIGYG